MKTSTLLVVASLLILNSCAKKEKTEEAIVDVDTVAITEIPAVQVKIDARTIGGEKSAEQLQIEDAIAKLEENSTGNPVIGYWVGPFGRNKITIAIADITGGKAIGYTVCAGNYRPVTGTVESIGDGGYKFDLNEPGTDQYDGHFEFTTSFTKETLTGKWAPFKKGAASAKTFTLEKSAFVYEMEHGEYPQASQRLLEATDVENLNEDELELMRNEIYARHGYSFKDKNMRIRFDTTSWYMPMGIDIRDDLTDIEVQNIDLIYEYENYLAENYDSYGR